MPKPAPFNPAEFAEELNAAVIAERVTTRALGDRLGLSASTISRATQYGGWPQLSHIAYLCLRAWLDDLATKKQSAA